jgi:hypothetical protein
MRADSKVASLLTGGKDWRIFGTAIVTAVVVGLAKYAVVGVLVRLETPAMYLRLQDSILTGLLAAVVVGAALTISNVRRKFLLKEVETVASLNHELRNALEVILGSEFLALSNKGEAILDSVERINRTLDNIVGRKPNR